MPTFTPVELRILLAVATMTRVAPHRKDGQKALGRLKTLEMVDEQDKLTPKGTTYINALCNVPLPVRAWVCE